MAFPLKVIVDGTVIVVRSIEELRALRERR